MLIPVAVQPAQMIVPGVAPTPWIPEGRVTELKGLIDTGASGTCLTRSAALKVGIRSRGKTNMSGVHGVAPRNRQRFSLGAIYNDNGERGYFWFEEVSGAEMADNGVFDVLIGMDVISQGDLHVMRDGHFSWVLG
ncbi:aspartyl protease family protein [Sphingomonas sp. S-NIH.Pt15_0812]|uniref:aspartyl protease family protein n=1 Tax=Sphingomonas sp. S-NIH.Pt15_0812 TaxID=1920129 RepID=UPI000F7ED4F5|nr:aspartyl protease family protein [Sphingomonas sp. S-NIH.Pt15_0812]RSU53975.1 hypothetical protein BRX43_03070 [Sphingomonas sp. S-NIH.Pt15_0812]